VVRGRHGELGVEEGKERVPKFTCEAGVSVGDDGLGEAVVNEDAVEEELSKSRGINVGSRWKEVGPLGELVDDGEDSVVATRGLGQLGNKVHCNTIPSLLRDFKGLE
jgi:hypothetical protein